MIKGSGSMSHKVYRLCLLSVALIAIIGGIFYYLNYAKKSQMVTDGTLVQNSNFILERNGSSEEGYKL